ncbi:YfiT family bacillithiol transferase [Flagellimonas baculiformis]|uniref:YfiT family bacillithiol transferase n=1 Tax=Flagellimonas baculiformis TaxID=3067310 RepID=UPI00296ED87A|nr:putative metal-dependent hydrolase [Muricauda sp. D6]
MNSIHIEAYRPEWQPYFERFNTAWIEKHFVLEEIDREVLGNPEGTLLKGGGKIWFALLEEQVIGTVALKIIDDTTMELTKMAVDEAHQGKGAGTKLCRYAVEAAQRMGAKKLVLYTQSMLKPALNIYRTLGFREISLGEGTYKRADTKMELVFATDEDLHRYPIGKFREPEMVTASMRLSFVQTIALFPEELEAMVGGLSDDQLDFPYRKGGWSIRQLIHHLADSNINCFARIKFALTEDNPIIKPFREEQWAETPDAKHFSVNASLLILKGLHSRWTLLLETLDAEDWKRTFFHPEVKKNQSVEEAMAKYSWHCRHHLAHISAAKETMGWN